MHDLVYDLAQSVARFDHHTLDDAPKLQYSNEVRRVSSSGSEEILTIPRKIDKIRTILFPYEGLGATGNSFVSTCASRFKCMGYLDLSNSDFEELPSSIGKLKYLRCLSLYRNKRIKKLPASICKLYHLQTLILEEC